MSFRIATICLALCIPLCALAQPEGPAQAQQGQEKPEEIDVIGYRTRLQLRLEMMAAEKFAYDVFNQFNDEKRFDISCSMQTRTGTNIESATQFCQPGFEIEALRAHAQDYFENTRDMLNQFAAGAPVPIETKPPMHIPTQAVIASQQREYRRKMKQVAEEHPEFLEAIIQYSEIRELYEKETNTAGE